MNIFDSLKKRFEKEESIETSRDLAKVAVARLLDGIRKSQKEESLQLIRHPSDGSEGINMEFEYRGANIAAPIYAYFTVKKLADIAGVPFETDIAGVPFETMIGFIKTFNELLPEVSRMEDHRKENEEATDED